ncbi:CoA-binding protein [Variovorax sp. WS11]|uniref:acetate--CoA ligase family protein n=1 Tax=Variovorax sp. WS11 TaxID=1105204 RepID=UPI000D0CB85B|nr:acetate--CoA ligase [Variovorax sp. WS11]NDZ13307.1 CoA-binding protein [Variovorax sp. WS11]PSL79361.1 CoA-binding protein [Variovorax sp. WS11]
MRDLTPLMRPASVAVLGASERPESLGNRVMKNLVATGYRGRIFPVHPTALEVEGLRCFSGLRGLPEVPDCVAVALSADKVIDALEEAAACGVRAAVVFASGFAETGEAGAGLQARLAVLCERTGLLVCGPNCLGLSNVQGGVALYSAPLPQPPLAGGVAVASHSGSACVALSSTGRLGLSHVVSVGNATVLDVDDYLDFFAADPGTRVAAMFMESVRHPARFAAAAQRMRAAGKPVVVLKVGRSSAGAAASAAHTGSLAGSHAAAVDFFRRAGVVLVDDMDTLIETCALMAQATKRPAGDGVAVINISGGEVALTCDLGQEAGLSFAPLGSATLARLRECLPSYATPGNPLDATGTSIGNPDMYAQAMRILLDDPGVAMLAVSQDCPPGLSPLAAHNYGRLARAAAELSRDAQKPIVFYSNVAGGFHPTTVAPLAGTDVAALQGGRAALAAIRHFVEWHSHTPAAAAAPAPFDADPVWRRRLASGQPLSEYEAKRFLGDHGIRVTREARAGDALQAAHEAAAIGFPVAMKIDSPDIVHKTEAGGVHLGLATEAAVRAAFEAMTATVRQRAPGVRIDGVLIQEMVTGGVEMIAGLSHQAPFGHAVVVGSGGVFVELVRDSSLMLVPVDAASARTLVDRTRAAKLLDGFRGAPPADRAAFEALVARLSAIGELYGDCIEAVDLNPVAVLPSGACVLDAWIGLRNPSRVQQTPGAHP